MPRKPNFFQEAQYYRNLAANFESKLASLEAEGQRAAAEAVQQAEAAVAAKARSLAESRPPTASEAAMRSLGGGLRIYEVALGALFLLLLIRWTVF